MNFFKHFRDLLSFTNLRFEEKEIVFYSEGEQYWPYLKEIVLSFLNLSNKKVCYVSSSFKDPGLFLKHKNLKFFCIGDKSVRHHFFKNLNCKMLIMTMPDLDNYHIVKSNNNVHYVYTQHSLNSLHMAYRDKAFNNFDTILCGGKHHELEINKIERYYNLSKIKTLRYRYEPPYSIKKIKKYIRLENCLTVLIAPTWGQNGLVESGKIQNLIKILIKANFNVIFRPHPETIKHHYDKINNLQKEFKGTSKFTLEKGFSGFHTLVKSDVLITDWSGIAFDFALGLERPIIFVNTEPKINNIDYKKIYKNVIEFSIRERIGIVLDCNDIPDYINKNKFISYKKEINSKIFFKNDANDVVQHLINLL